MRLAAALAATLLLGCNQTGILLEVGASSSSIQAGAAKLRFVLAHETQCHRWVDDSAPLLEVDVTGRELRKRPYELFIQPSHFTDFDAPVSALVVAFDPQGRIVGGAAFDDSLFAKGTVRRWHRDLALRSPIVGYAADDGCVCLPGVHWVGTGSGAGCDLNVVPSFADYANTAGCELPPGAPQLGPMVCDGQSYDEPTQRALPCFVTRGTGAQASCRAHNRACRDEGGVAYDDLCASDDGDPSLPSSALCQAYAECEKRPCGDVLGCLRTVIPTSASFACTLHVDPSTPPGVPVRPCPNTNGRWQAVLDAQPTGAGCTATVLDGVDQRRISVGFVEATDGGVSDPHTVASSCPPTLAVDHLDADSPADVPGAFEFDVSLGDHLAHVRMTVVRSCQDGPPLACRLQ